MLADVVVSASTEPEAFGRVVGEAQAMGRPVVVSGHGGAAEQVVQENMGLVAMSTGSGLEKLYQIIEGEAGQVMVLSGELPRLRAMLCKPPTPVALNTTVIAVSEESKAVSEDALKEQIINYFKQLLSSVIKLPAAQIEADESMESYGIDSVMVMQLTQQLEKTFGSLSKTLFFEYQSIGELSGYFQENYQERLIELMGLTVSSAIEPERATVSPQQAAPLLARSSATRFADVRTQPALAEKTGALDIAIIGLSGRYPQASNLEMFWKNLSEGKDSISEVPGDRWDWREYFTEDRSKPRSEEHTSELQSH